MWLLLISEPNLHPSRKAPIFFHRIRTTQVKKILGTFSLKCLSHTIAVYIYLPITRECYGLNLSVFWATLSCKTIMVHLHTSTQPSCITNIPQLSIPQLLAVTPTWHPSTTYITSGPSTLDTSTFNYRKYLNKKLILKEYRFLKKHNIKSYWERLQ